MVTELDTLMRRSVAAPPPDHLDLDAVVAAGRRRVRRRGAAAGAGVALATVAVVTVATVTWPSVGDRAAPAGHPPAPEAPTLRLSDAQQAVAGRDYEVLASYTNKNLDADNGQYFDGVTDDGLVLFRDGPRAATDWRQRLALLDPATGQKDWLPGAGLAQANIWPVELGARRLVLLSDNEDATRWTAYVYDRTARTWSTTDWTGLPSGTEPAGATVGPDGRLYLRALASRGAVPEGGWPTGADGEADDANAEGDTYHLWSASLTDASDVRDEGLTVGNVAFTDDAMVWTDRRNGAAGKVHVRDLASGAEHSFDPRAGDRCNVLGFAASGQRIVMSEYCGTYGDVRDDRVQILTTDGDQVATIQDSGIEGAPYPGSDVVAVEANRGDDRSGTYAYDLATDRFLRISDGVSHWGTGGPAQPRELFWHTPVNHGHGATWTLGRLLD